MLIIYSTNVFNDFISDVPTSRNRPFIDYSSFHPDQILNQDQPKTIDSQPESVSIGNIK